MSSKIVLLALLFTCIKHQKQDLTQLYLKEFHY